MYIYKVCVTREKVAFKDFSNVELIKLHSII